jgi:hypothetical protein
MTSLDSIREVSTQDMDTQEHEEDTVEDSSTAVTELQYNVYRCILQDSVPVDQSSHVYLQAHNLDEATSLIYLMYRAIYSEDPRIQQLSLVDVPLVNLLGQGISDRARSGSRSKVRRYRLYRVILSAGAPDSEVFIPAISVRHLLSLIRQHRGYWIKYITMVDQEADFWMATKRLLSTLIRQAVRR